MWFYTLFTTEIQEPPGLFALLIFVHVKHKIECTKDKRMKAFVTMDRIDLKHERKYTFIQLIQIQCKEKGNKIHF